MYNAKHTSCLLEVAKVPRQLREVVCIPDSCTTQIFKQCLEQQQKQPSHFLDYDTIINAYQLLKALPETSIFEAAYLTQTFDHFLVLEYWAVKYQVLGTKFFPQKLALHIPDTHRTRHANPVAEFNQLLLCDCSANAACKISSQLGDILSGKDHFCCKARDVLLTKFLWANILVLSENIAK